MILRLDPGDDEAEQKIRMALEKRSTRGIHEAFTEMLDTLYPQGYGEWQDPAIEAQRIHEEFLRNQKLQDAISRALLDGVDLGVSSAVTGMENVGFGFDWTLANIAARDWANQYSGQLIQGITQTTQTGVQQAVARFIGNSETLGDLINDLQPFFGKKRAANIAMTEITRSYAQGNLAAWREAGLANMEPRESPPAHPGCRCWLTMRFNDDGSVEYIWQTANDGERVCPVCGALHGQSVGFAKMAR